MEGGNEVIAVAELRMAIWGEFHDMTSEEKDWLDDACLRRYLRARSYDQSKAFKMLKNSMLWRREAKPHKIRTEEITSMSWTGSMYVHGTDKKGHPVVYMRTAFDPPGTAEEKIKFIMYTLEETIRHMPADSSIEKWMIVTDLHGFSLAKHGDSQVSRKFVEILQDHYPERLHSMVAINAPAIFVGFYKALSVFIDKTTRKKFQVKGKMDKKAAHEYLTQYITQDQLEDCYDGDLPTKVPPNIVEILEPLWEQHKSAIKEAKKEAKLDKKASKQANKLKNSASIEGESKVGGGTDSHTAKLTKGDTVYLDDSELVDEMAKL